MLDMDRNKLDYFPVCGFTVLPPFYIYIFGYTFVLADSALPTKGICCQNFRTYFGAFTYG